MRTLFLLCFFVSSYFTCIAQYNYPENYFRSPLDIPLILSGTFGELRSNHFHSGIDIKTQQREGLPVYAIADGVVTRIKISIWGYGKAIYVAHPNGYTSVYAHLQKFSPEIEAYIKQKQYEQETFEIELFPDETQLKVNKGDVIAYSGNTGGSGGPHLHFEIRNTATQKPINPLFFGFDVKDTQSPMVQELYAYPVGENSQVNQSAKKVRIPLNRTPSGSLEAGKVTALGTIGFGINTYDRQDLAYNKNGVYQVQMLVNGTPHFSYNFDSFSFTETRYINTLIDYEHYIEDKRRIQYCFKQPHSKLSVYNTKNGNGLLTVNPGQFYNIKLLVKDIYGNQTTINIPVEGKAQEVLTTPKPEPANTYLISNQPNSYNLGIATVYFPAGTFYKNQNLQLLSNSDTIIVHNNKVPVHRNFTITFNVAKYSPKEREKMFIAYLNNKNEPVFLKTYKRNNTFSARTKTLGKFTLSTDTIAPTIRPKNFKPNKWLSNYNYLTLKIKDDLSGIATYNAYLNGEWILMEYDPKTATLKYNFNDKTFKNTKYNLRVVVSDNVGNTTTYSCVFYKK